jgi:hypothetical protein
MRSPERAMAGEINNWRDVEAFRIFMHPLRMIVNALAHVRPSAGKAPSCDCAP